MKNIKIDGLSYFSEKKFKEEQQEWEKYRFASKNYPRVGKSQLQTSLKAGSLRT